LGLARSEDDRDRVADQRAGDYSCRQVRQAECPSTGVADPHHGDSANAHRQRQAAAKRSR